MKKYYILLFLALLFFVMGLILYNLNDYSNDALSNETFSISGLNHSENQILNDESGKIISSELVVDKIRKNSANPNLSESACYILYNLSKKSNGIIPYGYYNAWAQVDMFAMKNTDLYVAQKEGKWNSIEPRDIDIEGLTLLEDRGGVAPSMNLLDFCFCFGNNYSYIAEKTRAATITIVKKTWEEGHILQSFCWHLENPYTPLGTKGMHSNYIHSVHTNVVAEILNGTGDRCGFSKEYPEGQFANPSEWFDFRLMEVATLINEFTDAEGNSIPIIFRLWHEVEDSWAWWQLKYCSTEEYKQFFAYTVERLNELTCDNVIYVFNTDRYLLKNYKDKSVYETLSSICPIDYVDIISFDDYSIGDSEEAYLKTVQYAKEFCSFANDNKKLVALAESGNKTHRVEFYYYMQKLLLEEDINLAYINMWRNAGLCGMEDVTDEMISAMVSFSYNSHLYNYLNIPMYDCAMDNY